MLGYDAANYNYWLKVVTWCIQDSDGAVHFDHLIFILYFYLILIWSNISIINLVSIPFTIKNALAN